MDTLKQSIRLELESDAPRATYHRRDWDNKKDIIHWGQRKLLLSEIMFLTQYGHLSHRIVYAGAAPGHHIPYLSQLFPSHTFVLVDPNPFGIRATSQIELKNQYFDDTLAQQFVNPNILFISDMRTADYRQMSPLENEQYILKDNETQMRWIQIMHPAKSMIKFRCPYPDIIPEPIKMFQGTIMVQPWAPPTSTETRLILGPKLTMQTYDSHQYEEQLFYHNTVARVAHYPQPIRGEGLDQRFDASAEVIILYDFLTHFPQFQHTTSIMESIATTSQEISKHITPTKRTLTTHMKDPNARRHFPQINHRTFYQKK